MMNEKLKQFTFLELLSLSNAINDILHKPLTALHETKNEQKFSNVEILGVAVIIKFQLELIREIECRMKNYITENKN